jgi:hypothetical protein
MNRIAGLALSGLVLLGLAACGGKPEPQDEEAARELGRDTDKTVFDDMIQTQDKARAVEGVTLGHKADMDAAIDESSEGGSPDEKE